MLIAHSAQAFECEFKFDVDTQSSALQAHVADATAKGGLWQSIDMAPPDLKGIAKYVGRLDICLMTADGKPGIFNNSGGGTGRSVNSPVMTTCTAALLPGNRLLTNHHCFYDPRLVEAGFTIVAEARINFGYTAKDFTGDVKTFRVLTNEVSAAAELDAMVLQIVGADANSILGGHIPMVMETNTAPLRALKMVHHPYGDPQQFSDFNCAIHPDQAKLPDAASQLRHSCETATGSSGSLLLDERSLAIVGLHNQGGFARGFA
jgi:hypothetical protein